LWRLYASYNDDGEIEVKRVHAQPSCAGMGYGGSVVGQDWLQRVIPNHLFLTKVTKVQEIVDCIPMEYQHKITYEADHVLKMNLIQDRRELQLQQFQQMPTYVSALQQARPDIYINLQFENPASSATERIFQHIFICHAESTQSFAHMRKFMAVDGTFLKVRFIQTLLFAVGIDGNGKFLPLSWAVVESENTESWTWFLSHLKTAIPPWVGMTLISDRDKGLLAAEQQVYGNQIYAHTCCFHLKGMINLY